MKPDQPAKPLDYRSAPQVSTRTHWLLRIPQSLLWLILIIPVLLFAPMCQRTLPGQVLSFPEAIMPGAGAPISLILSILSFPYSSNLRRIGLAIIIFASGAMTYGLLFNLWKILR